MTNPIRTAIISDIHGNAIALKAVLNNIRTQNIDSVICLGDIATLGPSPKECLDLIKNLNCSCILGNHEEALFDPEHADDYNIKGEVLHNTINWCLKKLNSKDIDFLKTFQRTLTIPISKNVNMLCYHGSPKSSTDSILPTITNQEIDSVINFNSSIKIAVGGHTHYQMLRKYKDKIILNPGSVGCAFLNPFTSPPLPSYLPIAEYAIIEISEGDISIELKSIKFNFQEFKNLVIDSDIPLKNWWINEFNRIDNNKE
ncbi:hypothetical protein GTQ40_12800 [Flavobacteriaceae bacterium R38]|nr:hypothetical protein [Flavobacteriaceae bacterium R38]